MKKLGVVPFQSWKGNHYLYDDCTGAIIPSSPLLELALQAHAQEPLEKVIQELSLEHDPAEVQLTCDLIKLLEESWGAFYRSAQWQGQAFPLFDFPQVEMQQHILSNVMQLVLIVSENCNLRCRYCFFSDQYPLTRPRTLKTMSFETACRAVDHFFSLASFLIRRTPGKKLAITFYGGEPLLALKLLHQIVPYIKEHAPCEIVFNISTNATLLDREAAEFLIQNGFNIAYSLDGPEVEHDRNRVFSNETGSFREVWHNLQELKHRYPDFHHLLFLSVFDWRTDLQAVARFFQEQGDDLAMAGFVNPVNPAGTNYYQQFTSADRTRFLAQRDALWHDYAQSKIHDAALSPFTRCLFDLVMAKIFFRPRSNDARFPPFPIGGNCIPGMKLAVHPDGALHICERVNGTAPIGHLDTGLELDKIEAIIREYNQQITVNCFDCTMSKLCSLCFSLSNTEKSFQIPSGYCENVRMSNLESLQAYCSILEENPHAFDDLDQIMLGNWMLNL